MNDLYQKINWHQIRLSSKNLYMKLFKISTLVIGCTFLFASCSKKDMNTTTGTGTGTTPVTATVAPAGFNYSTTKTVTVNSSAMTNDNQPLAGVSMNIYTTTPSGTVDKLIYKGFTDKTGSFATVITIPAAQFCIRWQQWFWWRYHILCEPYESHDYKSNLCTKTQYFWN